MMDSPEVQFATTAVREAALLVREIQRELVGAAITKEDRSPVTVADFASQAIVAKRLSEQFPDDVLVAEENATALRTSEAKETLREIFRFVQSRIPDADEGLVCDWIDQGNGDPSDSFWTLDPIDGTKGFLRREQYAVALAKVVAGRVEIGVLGCPELSLDAAAGDGALGAIVVAVRGSGVWCQSLIRPTEWRPIKVSHRKDPAQARLLRSVESGHTNTGQIGQLVDRLGIIAPPVPMDSQAKYAALAAGQGDVLVRLLSTSRPDYREAIWDQAAGSIVVEEAGGRVSDADGKPLDFTTGRRLTANRGVLATNGHLHDAIVSAISAIGA